MMNTAVAPNNAAQAAAQSSGASNTNNTSNTNSTSSTTAAQLSANNTLASLAGNFQSFLTLLTTQLKNQDPTSPLDTSQFTQQITQMTGVEQQLLSNQLLQQLVTTQGGVASSANLLGETVTAPGVNSGDPNISGVVSAVTEYDGQTMLTVGNYVVPIGSIISISDTPSTPAS
jgi:flagellar basal-body rod modification protein FlgD